MQIQCEDDDMTKSLQRDSFMALDTGKASIDFYQDKAGHADNTIVVINIYTDDNLKAEDIDAIHQGILAIGAEPPVDTICVKSGQHALTDAGVEYSLQEHGIHNRVVYVIKHMQDLHFPSKVQTTFFKDHLVDYTSSVDEAYRLLRG